MVRPALLRLLENYFRHRWLYLLPILIMLSIGVVYILTKPPTYLSAGTLRIQKESLLASMTDLRAEGYSYFTPAEETVDELNELINSDAFIRGIIRNTDLEGQMNGGSEAVNETITEARRAIWAQTLGKNLVLIGSSHEDANVAFQLVRSTMDTYIQSKIYEGLTESEAAQTFFSDIINTYRGELDPARRALIDYLTDHPEPIRGERPAVEAAEVARLQAEVNDVQERLRNAQSNDENARLARAQTESDVRQTYAELDSPRVPTDPSQSLRDLAITLIVFGAIGTFLSLVGIVGGALLDRTFRFPVDVRQSLHLPVLGMVPAAATPVAESAVTYPASSAERNTPAPYSYAPQQVANRPSALLALPANARTFRAEPLPHQEHAVDETIDHRGTDGAGKISGGDRAEPISYSIEPHPNERNGTGSNGTGRSFLRRSLNS